MKILLNKSLLFAAFIVLVLGTFAFSAFAQTDATAETTIQFPITELGSCESKEACRAYCAVEENHDACKAFAEKKGLKKPIDTERINAIKADGGPGGCATDSETPLKSCHEYCAVAANAQTCIEYAKEHNLYREGEKKEKAEKILTALESGEKPPEGCREPKDIATARACFEFAEKAGILPPGVTRERAEKMWTLIEDGKAPFKTLKEFKQCENAESEEVKQKCLTFAEENDLVAKEKIAILKETGGKGPGGCVGKEQCDLYCKEHRDECFTFAKEHNLISSDEKNKFEEGVARFKASLENMPEPVKECVTAALGTSRLDTILGGMAAPNPEDGDRMRACFEKLKEEVGGAGLLPKIFNRPNSSSSDPTTVPPGPLGKPGGAQFPPEMRDCIMQKLGVTSFDQIKSTDVEPSTPVGQAISACRQMLPKPDSQTEPGTGKVGVPPQGGGAMIQPPALRHCLVQKLGEDLVRQRETNTQTTTATAENAARLEAAMRACKEMMQTNSGEGTAGVSTKPIMPGTTDRPVACTMDARVCPDGSAVGRTGPNCQFAPCPGEKPTTGTAPSGTMQKPPMPTGTPGTTVAPRFTCGTLDECKKFCSIATNAQTEVCRKVLETIIRPQTTAPGTTPGNPATGVMPNTMQPKPFPGGTTSGGTSGAAPSGVMDGTIDVSAGFDIPEPPAATTPGGTSANPFQAFAAMILSLFVK